MSLSDIQSGIAQAAQQAGRDSGSVTLLAVSKVQPNDRVQSVLEQGHRVFGENYLQETADKWPAWRASFPRLKAIDALRHAIQECHLENLNV